jgi:hypothetical protein
MKIGSRLTRSNGYVALSMNGPDIGATARHRSGYRAAKCHAPPLPIECPAR